MLPSFARHELRFCVVGAITLFLLAAVAIPGLHSASADPTIMILPTPSHANDGKELEIRIRAALETGNSIDMIRITLDPGTAGEKFYEFDINGRVIRADAGLADANCQASFESDGYSVGPSVVDCNVVLDKSVLTAGTHHIRSELVSEIGVFADDSEYMIATE